MIIAENDRGYLLFDGNELTIGSKIGDPPKLRLTSPINDDGGGGGVVSYNASRHAGVVCDGHQQTEMAMDRVEQAQDVRGQVGNYKAERNFMVSDASGDGADGMHKPLAFTYDAVTHNTLGLAGTAPGGPPMPPALGAFDGAEFIGSNGQFIYARQTDGHDVLYDMRGATRRAIWASDMGWIG